MSHDPTTPQSVAHRVVRSHLERLGEDYDVEDPETLAALKLDQLERDIAMEVEAYANRRARQARKMRR